jgi:hypothetical protein
MTVASTAVEIAYLDPAVVPVILRSAVAVAVAAPLLLDLPNYYWYPSFFLR